MTSPDKVVKLKASITILEAAMEAEIGRMPLLSSPMPGQVAAACQNINRDIAAT